MIEHQDEIFARPARTWFQTEKEKAKAVGKSRFIGFAYRGVTLFSQLRAKSSMRMG